MSKDIGIVLTAGTTSNAIIQLKKEFEHSITEGKLVEIQSHGNKILGIISRIKPHNDFYSLGDAWSESRRQGYNIPQDVARQYVICDVEILGTVPGLKAITQPPLPGNLVFEIDVSDPKVIFGITNNPPEPGYVWYGTLKGYDNAPVPLSIEEIVMHMAVFGTTGSGKSFMTGALLEKFVNIPLSNGRKGALPMIIIDSNGDYTDYPPNLASLNSACPQMTRFVFPDTPDVGNSNVQELTLDLGSLRRSQLAEVIMQYYAGNKDLEEMQVNGIERILEDMEEANLPNGFGDPNVIPFRPRYNHLFVELDIFNDFFTRLDAETQARPPRIHSGTAGAIRRAMNKFRAEIFPTGILNDPATISNAFLDNLTDHFSTAIFDLSNDGAPGVSLELKQVIVGIIASLLFDRFNHYKIQSKREKKRFKSIIFAIEEAENNFLLD